MKLIIVLGSNVQVSEKELGSFTSVALVSAPNTTPSLKTIPAIVVPVFLALGTFKPPFFIKNSFLWRTIMINHLWALMR